MLIRSARPGALALLGALSLATAHGLAAQDTTRHAPDSAQSAVSDSARAAATRWLNAHPALSGRVDTTRPVPVAGADTAHAGAMAPAGDTTHASDTTHGVDTTRRAAALDSGARVAPSRKGKHHARTRTRRVAAGHEEEPLVWPVTPPPALPGSILPAKRIVAFYGNPLSKHMGILGALPPERMLAKLDSEVQRWQAADSSTPVQPALQLIAVVAQSGPGRDGKYRMRMSDAMIERVYSWAQERHALFFLDVQVGKSTLQEELPRLVPYLARPDVELAIDPEFSMKHGQAPGKVIGTFDAADVNYASSLLDSLVTADSLPPKVLVVHRFTRPMLTHSERIRLDPRTQIVIDMDGWGPPSLKRGSYRAYIYRHPVEYTGFKLFYHNDTKGGTRLMSPKQVLELFPKPLYIQYQ